MAREGVDLRDYASMRTLVVIRPNETAATWVCRRMIVPSGEILTAYNDAAESIVFAFTATLRHRVDHPSDLATRLK